jgi:hypothetical protein
MSQRRKCERRKKLRHENSSNEAKSRLNSKSKLMLDSERLMAEAEVVRLRYVKKEAVPAAHPVLLYEENEVKADSLLKRQQWS